MSTAIATPPIERSDGVPSTAGPPTPEGLPEVIAPGSLAQRVAPAATGSHAAVSVGASLLGHVTVLACLAYLPGVAAVRWMPVDTGAASIRLQASFSAPVEEDLPPETAPAWLAANETPRSEPTRPPVLTDAVTAAAYRPPDHGRLPPMELADEPDSAEATPRAAPLAREMARADESPEKAMAERTPSRLRLARSNVTVGRPSPHVGDALPETDARASAASRGAQSSTPALVHNPAPAYPADALAARQTGRVVLRVRVAADGSVTAAEVYRTSGVPSLDRAAERAVLRWKFAPADSPAAPVRELAVPVRFTIEETG